MDDETPRQDPTRRRLLLSGAAWALGLSGSKVELASATAPPMDDPDILAGLVSVELLSIKVVGYVLSGGHLRGSAQRLARRILLHEHAHAGRLSEELSAQGRTVPLAPHGVSEIDSQLAAHHTDRRVEGVHDERSALDLLLAMESIAEGGLYGAMSKLAAPGLLTLGARLLACEAQHEAALGVLVETKDVDQATPYAFVEGVG